MSFRMVKYKDYTAGWLDSSVHDFLAAIPSAFPSIHYALITCLDSNRDLSNLLASSPELAAKRAEMKTLGQGLLLPTSVLLAAEASDRIMFGFDEVWFFPHADIRPKPAHAGLVGPHRVSQESMDALGEWMESNSCTLALGDGEGLNFILQARGLVRYFIGNSIQQPVPFHAATS
jgi:hypothetical protein